jgi:hypothetical protein
MVAPYQPFPVEALPGPIRSFVAQAAMAMGCDPSFVAQAALAVAAGLIGNTRVIQLKRGWTEPCVIWSAVVGDSGTLKTPAALKAVAYLYRLQKHLLNQHRTVKANYDTALETFQARRKRARDAGSPDTAAPPDAPVLQRVLCSDLTIEKLAEILSDNPRGTFVVRDELAGWLGSFARYKGKGGGSDLPLWLEAFRANAWVYDRKTGDRPSLFVPRAAVSITGGIQPRVLARILTGEHFEAGLPARILWAMPPRAVKQWSELEIDPDTNLAYCHTLDMLLKLDFAKDEDGELAPHVLPLDASARVAWINFYNGWAREQDAVDGELAAVLSKLEAYAARLALVHHVVTHVGLDTDDRRPVGTASIEAGITLCRWYAREAQRIYTVLAESHEQCERRPLIELVQARGGSITARELQQASRRYPTAEHADAALDELVQAGLGTWEDRPASPKGGRPTRVFHLDLSTVYETYETSQASQEDGI